MLISTLLIFRTYQTMPANLILNIMLGKLQNCNKGTRVPEVTSVTLQYQCRQCYARKRTL